MTKEKDIKKIYKETQSVDVVHRAIVPLLIQRDAPKRDNGIRAGYVWDGSEVPPSIMEQTQNAALTTELQSLWWKQRWVQAETLTGKKGVSGYSDGCSEFINVVEPDAEVNNAYSLFRRATSYIYNADDSFFVNTCEEQCYAIKKGYDIKKPQTSEIIKTVEENGYGTYSYVSSEGGSSKTKEGFGVCVKIGGKWYRNINGKIDDTVEVTPKLFEPYDETQYTLVNLALEKVDKKING